MNDITNLRDTIVPKSDQLNAEQLITCDMTIVVTGVSRNSSAEQPISINYEGDNGRPYKPCKTMRKLLVFAWGADGTKWIGRVMTLYNDLDVKWAGEKVGGIRISAMSNIAGDISVTLTESNKKKKLYRVNKINNPIEDLEAAAQKGIKTLKAAWDALEVSEKKRLGKCPEYIKNIANEAETTVADRLPQPEANGG